MDEYIVSAKRETKEDQIQQNQFYTYAGKEQFVDKNNNLRRKHDDVHVAAKKIYRDDLSYKLMIRCDKYGKPFDPNNQISHISRTSFSYKDGYKFIEVSQKAFDNYIKYLNTKNKAWLLNTERELA